MAKRRKKRERSSRDGALTVETSIASKPSRNGPKKTIQVDQAKPARRRKATPSPGKLNAEAARRHLLTDPVKWFDDADTSGPVRRARVQTGLKDEQSSSRASTTKTSGRMNAGSSADSRTGSSAISTLPGKDIRRSSAVWQKRTKSSVPLGTGARSATLMTPSKGRTHQAITSRPALRGLDDALPGRTDPAPGNQGTVAQAPAVTAGSIEPSGDNDRLADEPRQCKDRPDSATARKGGGGSRPFVPWCKGK